MKNSNHCPKCNSTAIVRVPGGSTWTGTHNKITTGGIKPILVTRYLCGVCGFSEEWIDDLKDIDKLIKKHGRKDTHTEFL